MFGRYCVGVLLIYLFAMLLVRQVNSGLRISPSSSDSSGLLLFVGFALKNWVYSCVAKQPRELYLSSLHNICRYKIVHTVAFDII